MARTEFGEVAQQRTGDLLEQPSSSGSYAEIRSGAPRPMQERRALQKVDRERIVRLAAYVLGQAIGYGIDLLIFLTLMTVLQIGYPVFAHLCGKFGSAALTYFYHARFSFPGEKTNSRSSSTFAYVVMIFINMALTSTLLKLLIFALPQHVVPAKIVSDVIGVLVTYLIMRNFVFPRAAS